MNIALAQINIESGNCEKNFQTIKDQVEQAKKECADVIVFPEMAISGYLLQDKFLDHEFCLYVHSFNNRVKALSKGIGIIFGNLYYDEIFGIKVGRDGRQARYNTALFAYDDKWVKKENEFLDGIHIKHLNPDYRIFDDSRYFLSGIEVSNFAFKTMDALISPFLFEHNGTCYRIALEVCEDIWSFDYSIDVTHVYTKQNIDVLINISSSPYTPNKELSRHKQMKKHAQTSNMPPVIYVNACGMQNNGKNIVMFDGGSSVYNTKGDLCFGLRDDFKAETLLYDFETNKVPAPTKNKMLQALLCSIYEFDRQIFPFQPKWIIGLSGGIDSCLNAVLLSMALGEKRVIAYNLASKYNSDHTKSIARTLADQLGIELREGSIEVVRNATSETMIAYGYQKEYDSLIYENIQARVRGHMLSTFASIENGVIINNGNKVEIALGYCTLYGDTIGAISPLGDLSKIQLFNLARTINEVFKKEIISEKLIPNFANNQFEWLVPPSAELKNAQVDPMKWYYHDWVIQYLLDYPSGQVEHLLQQYLDGDLQRSEVGTWLTHYSLDEPKAFIEDLEWLLKKIHTATFKRIQMPPIVLMSRGAFGNDFRESQIAFMQSDRYKQLRKQILK